MRKFLVLALLCPFISMCQPITIKGKVITEEGTPIQGATVTLIRTTNNDQQSTTNQPQTPNIKHQTVTDASGTFTIPHSLLTDSIRVSAIDYQTVTEPNNERGLITVILNRSITELDDVVVIGYGTTTRRLATGSVTKVGAEEIGRQPVANPLNALQGRVPGLIATQSSGVPGSAVNIQIRGQNSIMQGNEPLYIIDGVPYAPGNTAVNQLGSIASPYAGDGLSPFNIINPANIESIEVLKDADATAIYGSRGANGVVLITTKKGVGGKTSFTANVYTGAGKITRMVDMMNTSQYLQMRREAFANDGITPTITNAPDLLVWDTTRYTDHKKYFIGGTAKVIDAQASLSGGNVNTQFLFSTGYRKETSVFPGNMGNKRSSFHLNLNHTTINRKLALAFTAGYVADVNDLISYNLTSVFDLPPNMPSLYTADGKLNWQEGGVSFQNPLAYLMAEYVAKSNNLMANSNIKYSLLPGLFIKTNIGFNAFNFEEISTVPATSQNPFSSSAPVGYSNFGNNSFKSWIIEPQAEYSRGWGLHNITALVGSTLQQTEQLNTLINAYGYTNDALLKSVSAASSISVNNRQEQYRYTALFGRLNYNYKNTILLNLTGRHDGSSRFGPGKQFASYGAVGAGFIFTDANWFKTHLQFLSFGKIRGSFGTTGNDQIRNYQFLNSWEATSQLYQNTVGLSPSRLYNPAYSWELNRKAEGALDLGFLKDAILFSAAYFTNQSSNQLINYNLPSTTGFTRMVRNFPAVVQNWGWEVGLNTNTKLSSVHWRVNLAFTIAKNKLLSFPGIESSTYANTYVVGQSLSVVKRYEWLGVDPVTGIYTFSDNNGDGVLNSRDYIAFDKLLPKFYGGLGNEFSFKGLQLNFFFHFVKQQGLNYLSSITYVPGTMNNLPVEYVNRWQKPGNALEIQRFSTTASNAAYRAMATLRQSTAVYTDASFIRLKNIALSYSFPPGFLTKAGFSAVRIYLQGQNLLTLTNYKGSDPETQHLFKLPPLKTATAGIQFTL